MRVASFQSALSLPLDHCSAEAVARPCTWEAEQFGKGSNTEKGQATSGSTCGKGRTTSKSMRGKSMHGKALLKVLPDELQSNVIAFLVTDLH